MNRLLRETFRCKTPRKLTQLQKTEGLGSLIYLKFSTCTAYSIKTCYVAAS